MDRAGQVTEYSKIFINIASILLGLSVTFMSRIAVVDLVNLFAMIVSWAACVASIFFGAKAIRALVVVHDGEDEDDDEGVDVRRSIFSPSVRGPLDLQVVACLAGFVGIAAVALRSAVLMDG